jgi:hypothetical protein
MSPLGLFALSNPCLTRETISLKIYESEGAVYVVESHDTRASSLLMIYVSLGAVCPVESLRHACQQFVDDLRVPRGCLRCRIPTSPVPVVRLLFMSP